MMSKEKLQEIWDNYTVGDKEYLNQLGFIGNDVGQLMKLAYNQALEDASESAEMELELKSDGETVHKIRVSKQSILKLKIK